MSEDYGHVYHNGKIEVYIETEEKFMEVLEGNIIWTPRKRYRLIAETADRYEWTGIIDIEDGYVYFCYNLTDICRGRRVNIGQEYSRRKILASRIDSNGPHWEGYKFKYVVGDKEECKNREGSGHPRKQIELLKKLAKEVIN